MPYPTSPHDFLPYAWAALFPDKPLRYQTHILYSGRLGTYNASIRLSRGLLEVKMSRNWRGVSPEIQIGAIQDLLVRLTKIKRKTTEIDLYHHFVRSLHKAVPKHKTHPRLEESFKRVNERYFLSTIEQPNLVWAQHSVRKLGSYNFKTDTIHMSKVFLELPDHLLDYVMYHEMLHKRHQYRNAGLRNTYHSKAFKEAEGIFENEEEVEKELHAALRKSKIRRWLPWG